MLCIVLHCLIWGLLFLSVLVLCEVSSGYVNEQELRLFQMSYTMHFISRRKFMLQWVINMLSTQLPMLHCEQFFGILMPTNLIFLCWCFCEGLKFIFASLVLGSGLGRIKSCDWFCTSICKLHIQNCFHEDLHGVVVCCLVFI
jgi:hypothetical protein